MDLLLGWDLNSVPVLDHSGVVLLDHRHARPALLGDGRCPRRFDRVLITVDSTGDAEALACVLRSTDDYGFCTGVAPHFSDAVSFALLHVYTKGVTFHASQADSRLFLPAVIELVESGAAEPRRDPDDNRPMLRRC